jgi:energy-coupling factor transport system ATP-binding protein
MAVPEMKLVLDSLVVKREGWSLSVNGTFLPGVHLVSGDVGSGKSTLAQIIAGFQKPAHGTVSREGISKVMLSMQHPEYHITGLTVEKECASWGLNAPDILASAMLSGKEEESPFTLSRGELKRLHLACVLERATDLLLLDEPFSSLDCAEKERVCTRINQKHYGITIIFTHEQTTFPRVDHIWEICQGCLVDCGDMPGALERWQHAPARIQDLIRAHNGPRNLTTRDILEAAWQTHESG